MYLEHKSIEFLHTAGWFKRRRVTLWQELALLQPLEQVLWSVSQSSDINSCFPTSPPKLSSRSLTPFLGYLTSSLIRTRRRQRIQTQMLLPRQAMSLWTKKQTVLGSFPAHLHLSCHLLINDLCLQWMVECCVVTLLRGCEDWVK